MALSAFGRRVRDVALSVVAVAFLGLASCAFAHAGQDDAGGHSVAPNRPTAPRLAPGEDMSVVRRPGMPAPSHAAPPNPSTADSGPNVEASAAYMDGHARMTGNDIDGALAAYSRAVALEPTPRWRAYLLHARGFFLLKAKGDRDGALADFSEAIGLDQVTGVAATYFEMRSGVWMDKQAYDRAISDLSAAIRINEQKGCGGAIDLEGCRRNHTLPSESQLLALRGEAWMYKKDYPRAIADLDRAIALNPKNAVAYTNRGRVHASRGDFTTALIDGDRAVALDPKSVQAHFYRGLVQKHAGHPERAIADLQKVLELDPSNALARTQLEEIRRTRPPSRQSD